MDEGAQVSVDGENIADNGTAMAQDGRIVFSAWAEDGYEITSVLVDGEKDARHNGDSTTEYIIEGIKTDETVVSVSTQALDTEASETGEDSAVKNVVTFQVAEGAAVTVDGKDVADNGTAMAKDGTIVFFASPKDGYEITSVIFDGDHETRKTSDESGNEYILEGIQTDETVISVSAQPVDDGIRRNVVTFEVAKGAAVTVDGENVADGGTAMAKDGTIIFQAVPEDGYEITSVIFDGDHETRKTDNESGNEYILEGIETDETVISVSTQGPETDETEAAETEVQETEMEVQETETEAKKKSDKVYVLYLTHMLNTGTIGSFQANEEIALTEDDFADGGYDVLQNADKREGMVVTTPELILTEKDFYDYGRYAEGAATIEYGVAEGYRAVRRKQNGTMLMSVYEGKFDDVTIEEVGQLPVEISFYYIDGTPAANAVTEVVPQSEDGKYRLEGYEIEIKAGYSVQVEPETVTLTDGKITAVYGADTKEASIVVWYEPQKVDYEIHLYYQNLDGGYPEEYTTIKKSGLVGELTEYDGEELADGFTIERPIEHTQIQPNNADGTNNPTVVNVRCKRNEYTLSYDSQGGSYVEQKTGLYEEEKEVYTKEITCTQEEHTHIEAWDSASWQYNGRTEGCYTCRGHWRWGEHYYSWDFSCKKEEHTHSASCPSSFNPIPERQGYTFAGWYMDKGGTQPADPKVTLEKDVTVYAKWVPQKVPYTIVYRKELIGTDGRTSYYAYHDHTTAMAEVGTTVTGSGGTKPSAYYNDGVPNGSAVVAADGSTVVYVDFPLKTYTYIFDLDNEDATLTMNGKTYTDGRRTEKYTITGVKLGMNIADQWPTAGNIGPESQSSRFSLWNADSTSTTQGVYGSGFLTKRYEVTTDMLPTRSDQVTFTAKWSDNLKGYNVEYWLQSADGERYEKSDIYSQPYNYTSKSLTAKEIDGYTHRNRTPDGYFGDTGNTQRFYYDRVQYNITFMYHTDTLKTSDAIRFEADIRSENYEPSTRPADVAENAVFAGWYDNAACLGDPYVFDTMPGNNLVLYAKWENPRQTVTLVYNNGTEKTKELSVEWNTKAPTEEIPYTRDAFGDDYYTGHEFQGWYKDAECTQRFDSNEPILEDTMLYAKWAEVKEQTYTVNYFVMADGGKQLVKTKSSKGDVESTVQEKAIKLDDYPEYVPDEQTKTITISSNAEKNVIEFVYSAPEDVKYTVEYQYKNEAVNLSGVDGWTGTRKEFTTSTASVVVSPEQAVADYVNRNLGLEIVEKIQRKTLSSNEDSNRIVFTLRPRNYTITYEGIEGASGTEEYPVTYTVESEFKISDPYKDGYDFLGWSMGDGTTAVNNDHNTNNLTVSQGTKGNLTFVAHWAKLIDVNVTKVWDDSENQDGIRPESVSVTLSDNVLINPGLAGERTVELNEGNGWTHTWQNLRETDFLGNKVNYSIAEQNVPDGYTATVTGDAETGFTVTNTHTLNTLKTGVKVSKEWDDVGNLESTRPESVSVQLMQNGEEYGSSVTLNAENGWTYTWENLPEHAKGEIGIDAVYTVQETVVPAGYDKTVTGNADTGFTITNKHNVSKFTVEKTVSGATGADGKAEVGNVLTYTVTVENTGNTDLSGLTLTDEFSVDRVVNNDALTWTEGNPTDAFGLRQGETKTFKATYEVQATDNELSNTAKVGNETSTVTTSVEDKGAWTVEKTVSGATGADGKAEVGNVLTYTVTVKNTGNTDLTGLTLIDEFSVDGVASNDALTWTEGSPADAFDLTQGETKTFKATYTVQASDNELSNTAKVGDETTTIPTPVEGKDAWKVTKTVEGATGADGKAEVGNVLTYTVTVENTGNTDLSDLKLEDNFSVGGVVKNDALKWTDGDPAKTFGLAQGETKTFTATYTVQATDNNLSNTAKVGDETTTIPTPVEGKDAWKVTKTVSGATGADGKAVVGDELIYTVTVENTGNTDLSGLTLEDEFSVDGVVNNDALTWTEGNPAEAFGLAQGETKTFTATYKVQAADNNLSNTAKVGNETTTIPTPVEGKDAWKVTKTVSGATGADGKAVVGDELIYTVTVENTGNTDLTGLTLTDEFSVDGVVNNDALTWTEGNPAEAFGLAQGETKTFTATYKVQAADNNLSNTAKVGNETTTIPTPVEGKDAWKVTKTVEGATGENGAAQVDDVLTYTVTVENTGNTDLSGLKLEDEFSVDGVVNNEDLSWTGEDPTAAFDLAQGAKKTFTATYTVQAADNNLSNTAKVGNETTTIPTPVEDKDAWTVEKTVSGATGENGAAQVGDELTYKVTVENTGNTDLTGLTLTDEFSVDGVVNNEALTWTEGNPAEVFDLEQGETKTFTATYKVQATDNNLSNTAMVGNETTTIPTPVEDKDAWTVTKIVSGTTGENGAAKVGDELVYTVTVENTGNTDLTGLKLEDEFSVDEVVNNEALTWTEGNPAEAFNLAQGAKKTFTATYTVQASDDNLSNTAKVGNETTTIPTPVEDKDAWTVTKTVSGTTGENGAAKVGDELVYTVTVENTGNTDLTGLKLEDEFSVDEVVNNEALTWTEGNPAEAFDLAQGATKTFTATYTVQATDNSLSNTAKVGNETTTIPTPVEDQGAWTVEKTVSGTTGENGAAKVGDKLTYTVTVENTGNTDLSDLTLTDEFRVDGVVNNEALTWTDGDPAEAFDLAQGATKTFTATYTVQATDNNLSNTAKVGDETTTIPTPVEDKDAWTVTKTVSGATGENGAAKVGDELTYTVTVENTGNTDLSGLTLTDEFSVSGVVSNEALVWTEGNPAEAFNLAQGETKTFTATYTVQAADNSLSNMAKVGNETTTIPTPVEDKDAWTVTKTVSGATGENGAAKAGDELVYTVTVENTGNTDLSGLALTDEFSVDEVIKNEALTWTEGNPTETFGLAKGETKTFTATYTVQATDNSLSNTATVGNETTTIPTPVEDEDAWTVEKTVSGATGENGAAQVGDELTYTVTVKNTGNTDLTGLKLEDEFSVDGVVNNEALTWTEGNPAEAFDLAQGATKTFTATYTVQATDNELSNTAKTDDDHSTTIPTPVEDKDAWTVEKTVSGATGENGAAKVGDVLTYTVTVENTGNTDLTGLMLTDEFSVDGVVNNEALTWTDGDPAEAFDLAQGATKTFTATYTVQAADNSLRNTAKTDDDHSTTIPTPVEDEDAWTVTKTVSGTTGENGAAKVGDELVYTVTVENTGNTDLTGLTLTDEFSVDGVVNNESLTWTEGNPAEAFDLGQGATKTFTATYTVQAADNSLSNTAKVGNETATIPTPVEDEDAWTVEKTVSGATGENGAVQVGDELTYTVTVENTGNTDLSSLTLEDEFSVDGVVSNDALTWTEGDPAEAFDLAQGATKTFTATYTVQATDNNLSNTATIGDETTTIPTPVEDEDAWTVTKTVEGAAGENGAAKVDDVLTYTVTVENTGNTDLSDLKLEDEFSVDGVVSNDALTWTEGDPAEAFDLAQGATKTFTATYTVQATDNSLSNTATVGDETTTIPTPVEDKDAWTVEKTVSGTTGENGAAQVGDELMYTVTVENTGNTDLSGLTLSDEFSIDEVMKNDALTWTEGSPAEAFDLAQGAKKTFTATYTVQATDNNLSNTAKVGDETTTIPTPVEDKDAWTVTKTVSGATGENGAAKVGDELTYTVTVENTGNTDLSGLTLTDEFSVSGVVSNEALVWTEGNPAEAFDLAQGATKTFTATYTVQATDNNLSNTATVGDETTTIPTPVEDKDAWTVTKTVSGATGENGAAKAGDELTYTVTVENTGNTDLSGLALTDEFSVDEVVKNGALTWTEGNPTETFGLAKGETKTFTATYTVQATDNSLSNTATVGNETTTIPTPVEDEDAWTVEKTVSGATGENGAAQVGDELVYTVTVKNTGNTDLSNLTLTDEFIVDGVVKNDALTWTEGNPADAFDLVQGATKTFKATYTVQAADNSLSNTAKTDDDHSTTIPTPVEDEDAWTVEKTVSGATGENGAAQVGDELVYTVTVKNTGNTNLSELKLEDEFIVDEVVNNEALTWTEGNPAEAFNLAQGETKTFTATYTVQAADNSLSNTAKVGDKEAHVNTEVKENPSLTSVKELTNKGSGENDRFKAGETATFDIVVENTGNTTQKNVVVADTMTGAVIVEGEGYVINGAGQAVIAEMAPGTKVTVKATYTVTQEDIDNQTELKNTATVEGEGTTPDPDPEEIPTEEKNGHLKVDKTTTSTPANGMTYALGETITYEITAENDGNLTLTHVVVTDELTGDEWTIETLAPGTSEIFTTEYVVTEADILAGSVLNVATATGTSPDPETPPTVVPGNTEDPTEPKDGHVTITKTTTSTPANGEAYVLGETITYSITAENDGNLTLTDVVVTDELTGDSWTIESLAPGESQTFTASHVVTEADILAGSVVNVATATGTSPDPETPPTVVPGDTEDPTDPKDGHLTIAKTVTGTPANGEAYALGETITYSITAENDGNLTLTNVVVTDALTGDSWTIAGLAPGESQTFTAAHVVTEADILAGSVVNVATATGTSPDPEEPDVPVIPGTEEIQTDPKEGHLTIAKTATSTPANGEAYVLGETVTYNITAANDGNLTITDITVTDELTGDEWTIESLAPGASESFTATHVVTEADILAGSVVNVATATGTSPDPEEPEVPVTPGTEEIQTEPKDGHLTIAKATTSTPANGTAYELGETITYSITAVNDGNLTITDITVTDELTADSWTVDSLAPGESQTFAASHVVTEADTLAGSVVNTAVAAGTSPDPDEPEVPVTPGETEDPVETPAPSLYVEKTAAQAEGGYALGGVVTYTIRVVNNGNTDVSGITVNDPLTGNTWTVDALAEGGETAFTATHVVTEADILAGSVTNVATAAGTAPDGSAVESEDSATVITEESRGHIAVAKTATSAPANGTAYTLGETVTYEITAANDGNLTITDITVTDELTGDSWTVESLAPGADQTFTTTHVVTEADISAGSVLNVATAAGTSPDPEEPEVPVTPGQEEVLTEDRNPAVAVDKAVTSTPAAASGRYAAGETVTYQVTVTNTGNLTLENLTLEDMITRPGGAQVVPEGIEEGLAGVESLAPGESASVTYSYVVTEADLGGSLVNSAVVEGTPVIPDPTPETPELQPQDSDSETVLTEEPADSIITVSKTNVDGLTGELLSLPGAQFYVALFADEQLTQRVGGVQTLAFGEDQATVSAAFEGLEPGTYYIAETDAEGNVLTGGEYGGGTFTPEYAGGQQVVITESGQSTAAAFQNLFAVLPEEGYSRMAELTVTKEVRDTSGAPMNSDETFYAGLFYDEACTIPAEGVSQQIIPFEMNGGSSASATAEVTILGDGSDTVLYVTEVTADGTPVKDAADFPYEVTVEGGKVTVNADSPEASARIINVAEEPGRSYYKAGDLTITKEVRNAEGRLVNSDETFYAGIFSDSAYTTLADNVSQPVVELNMQGASKMSVSVEVSVADEESGTILYVTEVTEDGKPVSGSASFAYDVTVEGGTVVMNGNTLEGNVKIVNAEASAEEPGEPEEPGTEEPGTEEPGTEEPGTEEPGTEESGTEEPGTEKPGTGDNGTDDGDNDRTGMSEAETEGSETVQSVRTGDETPVMTWMIIFLAAALAMFLTAVSCFRKRRSR